MGASRICKKQIRCTPPATGMPGRPPTDRLTAFVAVAISRATPASDRARGTFSGQDFARALRVLFGRTDAAQFTIGNLMSACRSRLALLAIALATGACLGAGTAAGTARAADANGSFAIRGIGSESCGTYVAALAKPDEFTRYASWLLGYATAHNRLAPDTYDIIPTEPGVDFPGVVAVVCRSNPQMLIENAASSAVTAIRPLRQTVASPLVQVSADGKTVSIHQDSLKRLQAALLAKQIFKGAANGVSSPSFTDALKAFQRKEGIPVTGLPDIDTFIRAIVKH